MPSAQTFIQIDSTTSVKNKEFSMTKIKAYQQ